MSSAKVLQRGLVGNQRQRQFLLFVFCVGLGSFALLYGSEIAGALQACPVSLYLCVEHGMICFSGGVDYGVMVSSDRGMELTGEL